MLTAACVTATVLGVVRIVREWLILRQIRAAMEGCSAKDRVRIGLRLAGALDRRRSAGEVPRPTAPPDTP
ncbi:hypothetical protein [Streptomyces erythrochromogenes]|uniref:hypothetical protein n=1 Tax=Streptomyces erythrochromogenes TaxID=285574 RepID=UPI00369F1F43